jgi:hypothetical protein
MAAANKSTVVECAFCDKMIHTQDILMAYIDMIPPHFNAFVCLSLPEDFDVDSTTLDQRYEDSMRLVHPDKWTSDMTQSIALLHASCINHAYQLLKDPVKRAQHMLEIAGAWPVPSIPDLIEAVWIYHDTGHHPLAWSHDQACCEFSRAWSKKELDQCQKAYWWLKVHAQSHGSPPHSYDSQ